MERIKRGNLRVDAINKSKKKRKKYIVMLGFFILLLFLGIFVLIKIGNKNYKSFVVSKIMDWNNTGSCRYMKYGDGIIRATKDGAVAVSSDGKKLWNVSYNMRQPLIHTCGDYAVIADQGSNVAYIIDGSGKSNMIDTVYPIVEAQVAKQGVIALLLNHDEEDYINLYSMEKSDPLATINTVVSSHGFPISIALSKDGKKLATSYVRLDNEKMVCQVSFYNFGDVGQNYVEQLVGSFTFSSFVPDITFIENDMVSVFEQDGFSLFSMEEKPSEPKKETFDTQVQDVFYNTEYIGAVLNKKDGEPGRRLVLYNLNGKKEVDQEITFPYSYIAAGEEFLVFYNDSSYFVTDLRGESVFSGTFSYAIDRLYPTTKKDLFFAVTDNGLLALELSETKEE